MNEQAKNDYPHIYFQTMNNKKFAGMNFGPVIGSPIRGLKNQFISQVPKDPGIYGDPKHYISAMPYEPVRPFLGNGYIPGHEGGGLTGGGSSRRPGIDIRVPPPDRGPIWDPPDTAAPGKQKSACTDDEQKMIEKVYHQVMNSSRWVNFLAQFEGLLECIRKTWGDGVHVICKGGTMRQIFDQNFGSIPNTNGERRMTFSPAEMASDDPTWAQRRMVQQLVWVCGGSKLDAYAVSTLEDDVLFIELADRVEELMEGLKNLEWAGVPYLLGKYVFWNPKTGEIYSYHDSENPIIPNPRFDRLTRERIKKWYRLP